MAIHKVIHSFHNYQQFKQGSDRKTGIRSCQEKCTLMMDKGILQSDYKTRKCLQFLCSLTMGEAHGII